MPARGSRFDNITALHTDFGNSPHDVVVAEYEVPQTNVRKTLFYKFGHLALPKWALIPTGILSVGLFITLGAIMLSAILTQPTSSVTYSQTCSKTSKCRSELGLICGSKGKCACPTNQYWYDEKCVAQPTYGEQCNQTTECRTDLGLICTSLDGLCICPNYTTAHTCDCPSTSYWTGSTCSARSGYLGSCNIPNIEYQCLSNLYCNGSRCICAPNTQYWNYTSESCFSVDKYLAPCNSSTSYSCDASASLICLMAGVGAQCPISATAGTTICDCVNGSYWNGGSCATAKSINAECYWACECDQTAGLQCYNLSCVCPSKYYWSTSVTPNQCVQQMNYTQGPCTNSTECDTTQGLTCSSTSTGCDCPTTSVANTCDCLSTQYYDTVLTSCQTRELYNESCTADYQCDDTLGLFCQLTASAATNCSCPEPVRANMCDCNMTSYWDGVACVSRLEPNASCSFEYQCQAGYTCIVNETSLGRFSDVCRCPLGQYYVNGSGCVSSKNYTESCIGSYQCYELAPLSCRYNDTRLTCLDSGVTPLPACDCEDNYFFDTTTATCISRLARNAACTDDCQCTPPLECLSTNCSCVYFYSSLNQSCVDNLRYGDECSADFECEATPNAFMSCVSGTCGCNSTGAWNGTSCIFTPNFRAPCSSDANCVGGLICREIKCLGSQKRCSCSTTSYYSASNNTCVDCSGTEGANYERFVISFESSDICVAVRDKDTTSTSISFTTAHSECASLSPRATGRTPELLSLHSTTELDCVARILRDQENRKKCGEDNYHYLGYFSSNSTFFDGTPYSSAFTSPSAPSSTRCLTYCSKSDSEGRLNSEECDGSSGSKDFGAICDYRVI